MGILAHNQKSTQWMGAMGACASALCVVHCFGTALFSFLAPAMMPYLGHNVLLERGVWIFAVSMAIITFYRTRVDATVWAFFGFNLVLGSYFFWKHLHKAASLALATLAVFQLLVLVLYHFRDPKDKPHCCLKHEGSAAKQ